MALPFIRFNFRAYNLRMSLDEEILSCIKFVFIENKGIDIWNFLDSSSGPRHHIQEEKFPVRNDSLGNLRYIYSGVETFSLSVCEKCWK